MSRENNKKGKIRRFSKVLCFISFVVLAINDLLSFIVFESRVFIILLIDLLLIIVLVF